MKAVLLFLASVVAAGATYRDAEDFLSRVQDLRQLSPLVRIAAFHGACALIVAGLWLYARIGGRVQGHIGGFVVLAALAVAHFFTPFVAPVLVLALLVVLCGLGSRVGTIYEASSFPSISAFLGLALLFALSLSATALPGRELLRDLAPRVPYAAVVIGVACVMAAGFIVIGQLRHRRVQPGAAPALLAAAVVIGLIAEAVRLTPQLAFIAPGALAFRTVAYLLLFAGAFLLFSHLLPPRAADEVRFNP